MLKHLISRCENVTIVSYSFLCNLTPRYNKTSYIISAGQGISCNGTPLQVTGSSYMVFRCYSAENILATPDVT